ncbi:MAG: transcription antitermination factor NusB [Clostridium fessum]
MTDGTALREIAAEILTEILEKGQYTHLALFQALSKYQYLEKSDRSFLKRIVDGTVEYKIQIDYIINAYSKTKVHKMKPFIRTLLRMSVYQIYYMDRVPDSAACNEAVRLAKKRGFSGLSGFVNGVLRSVARGKGKLTFPDDSVRYSMPDWILSLWKENYGAETTAQDGTGWSGETSVYRCGLPRAVQERRDSCLPSAQGVTAEETAAGSGVYRLTGVDYPESLDAFREGLIRIQDLSSSLAGDAAGIKEGDFVLDVCGAPGGKGLHAADLLVRNWTG